MADDKKKIDLAAVEPNPKPEPATKTSGGASPSAPDDLTTTVASEEAATNKNAADEAAPEPSIETTAGKLDKKDGSKDVEFDYDELDSDDDQKRADAIEKRMKPVPADLGSNDEPPPGWPYPEDRLAAVYPADQSTESRKAADKSSKTSGSARAS